MSKPELNKESKLDWQLQLAAFLLLVLIIVGVGIYIFLANRLVYAWFFGLTVGFILQRSRICFTAAFRDPVLFGMTELTRALILSLMITTLGFAGLQYFQAAAGLEIAGKIISLGWNLPLGGFIFGLGAAISGGCASGTLVRMGEGFQLQWIAFVGFIGGSVHGAYDARFWYQLFNSSLTSHLPALLGWEAAVIVQLIVLGVVYWFAYWREKDKFSPDN